MRQGCVLSRDLFNLYCEQILREIKDFKVTALVKMTKNVIFSFLRKSII